MTELAKRLLPLLLVLTAPAFAQPVQNTAAWATAEQKRGEDLFAASDFVGAKAAHRAALTVRTRDADPRGWAESIAAAGAAQSFRGIRARDAELLQGAVRDYRLALEVYTRDETPEPWAKVQNNLATALVRLAGVRGDGAVADLEAAEHAFRNILAVTTPEAKPADAGVVLYNIGTVQERIGDRLTGDAQRTRYREASATYARALDTLRRGGRFDYASSVERRVSPFMNRVAAMD